MSSAAANAEKGHSIGLGYTGTDTTADGFARKAVGDLVRRYVPLWPGRLVEVRRPTVIGRAALAKNAGLPLHALKPTSVELTILH